MNLKTQYLFFTSSLALLLILAACSSSATPTPNPTTDPAIMQTSVAQTVEAELTQVANDLEAVKPTETLVPTNTEEPTEALSTDIPTAIATAAPTATSSVVPPGNPQFDNHAEFVADVSIPDGTQFTPGETFTKTWRLKNIGKQSWTEEYSVVFANGDRMEGVAAKIAQPVPPGGTIDLSVEMIAPGDEGVYTGYWALSDEDKNIFGIGLDANLFFYVEIEVIAGETTTTPTPAPTARIVVNEVLLSADRSEVISACPYTFTFTGQVTFFGTQPVTYQLELTTEDTNYKFTLPGPATFNNQRSGTHTFTQTYTLQLESNVVGQAVLHILSPNDIKSSPVDFSLICQ